jgi:prefoldin subunit 2
MKPLEPARKCFRLVGGVLVERTVGDVLPAVQSNLDGIVTIMKQLAETYKKKEDDLAVFQKKFNIQVRG